ncbi:MAG: hypothetical protein MZV64_08060 [Ignavibacteriales bacterium]|nr:hypothetical protein [Ignavibacteriales bacterium]
MQQTYEWKVVCKNDTCSGGPVATWTFTTEQDPSLNVLFLNENFEAAAFPPTGWTLASTDYGMPTVLDNDNNSKWLWYWNSFFEVCIL